jgi:hypothetical protein
MPELNTEEKSVVRILSWRERRDKAIRVSLRISIFLYRFAQYFPCTGLAFSTAGTDIELGGQ